MVSGEFVIIMTMGTIIYIGGFELPDKNAAAHRVLNNGKIFRELGYDVVFISIDRSINFNSVCSNPEKIQGFDTWFIPYPQSNQQWLHHLCDIKIFLSIVEKYSDVKAVICYNYQTVAFMKIKKYCKVNRIKIMADCTEWYSTKGTNIIFMIIKGIDTFFRMRIVQKQLDGLIVISKYLENYYRKSKNVIRIPPLVDLSELKWNQPVTRVDDGKIRFVYAGSPGQSKDKLNLIVDWLREQQRENIEFNIIGITKEQYLRYYPKHIEVLNALHEYIHFFGRISHNEALQQIVLADFTIFLRENNRTTKAGFPTKFVESISCGTPVITNRNSDLSDYLVNGENGFFVSKDINSDMQIIFASGEEKLQIIKDNLNRNIFDYRNWCEQLINIID